MFISAKFYHFTVSMTYIFVSNNACAKEIIRFVRLMEKITELGICPLYTVLKLVCNILQFIQGITLKAKLVLMF